MQVSIGKPLTYKSLEQIGEDTTLASGQYYIFRKEKEAVFCTFREQVERALDPVGVKEDFIKKMQEQYGETPRVIYLKIEYSRVDDFSATMGRWIIADYKLEIQLQDTGSITAAMIIAIAIAVVVIGSFLIAAWLIYKVIGAAEEVGGPIGVLGVGLLLLVGFFILAVLFLSGGKASVSKKGGVKLG